MTEESGRLSSCGQLMPNLLHHILITTTTFDSLFDYFDYLKIYRFENSCPKLCPDNDLAKAILGLSSLCPFGIGVTVQLQVLSFCLG